MAYDIGWIIPRLRNPGMLWNCASSITVAVVGLFSKIIVDFLNKTTVYNREALQKAVRRPRDVPLLTVSNHHSCFDDPGLWGENTRTVSTASYVHGDDLGLNINALNRAGRFLRFCGACL